MLNKSPVQIWKSNPMCSVRLVCFPYAGGSSSIYSNWWKYLPSNIEVVAIQLPGRGTRISEKSLTSVKEIIDDLMESIISISDKPLVFFGHSMGGLVSFELARKLQEENHIIPKHLIVSAKQAPHIINANRDKIHKLPDADFINKIKEYEGTPNEMIDNEIFLSYFVPMLRADFAVSENHTLNSEVKFKNSITVMGANDDPFADIHRLSEWSRYTEKECDLHEYTGGHFYYVGKENKFLSDINKVIRKYVLNESSCDQNKPISTGIYT